MLKVENLVTPSPEQWEFVMRGMRNAMNSWDKMDSYMTFIEDEHTMRSAPFQFFMGENDTDLASRLAAGGSVHGKYRRQLPVMLDIIAPLYWWKEFDTYKVGTVTNSCSTMHKIHAKEFELSDFSREKTNLISNDALRYTIYTLNTFRNIYNNWDKLDENSKNAYLVYEKKDAWDQMIQLLPTSYNQRRSISMNYENVYEIVRDRTGHKLDEWATLIDIFKQLPYYGVVVGATLNKNEERNG